MDNPLELPPPTDPVARVHEFARDLAYGAVNGLWTSAFTISSSIGESYWFSIRGADAEIVAFIEKKWEDNNPNEFMLVWLGYLTLLPDGKGTNYQLTPKAFSLLEKPVNPLIVFLSYRRNQSSALVIAVEARLKLADRDMQVFVDKDIPVGNAWEDELREKIRRADYFIGLIGAQTLDSPNVMDEIEWALDANCRIVTILHPAFRFEHITNPDARQQNIIAELNKRQLIMINSESAEHYDSAIRKLLNTLGYSTL